MKVAIMQPYIFPYIGYWQLINLVDKFVILDDVNYIMRGFINRNSILLSGKAHRFTISVRQASQNRLIKDTKLNFDIDEKQKFLEMIKNAYCKAPFYQEVFPLIKDIILFEEDDLTLYIYNSIEKIVKYLNISTEIVFSSQIEKDDALRGQDRILEICKKMGAKEYINPCGGRLLYSQEDFAKENMELFFLESRLAEIEYPQGTKEFVNGLSIIDIMMFNSINDIKKLLEKYDLGK